MAEGPGPVCATCDPSDVVPGRPGPCPGAVPPSHGALGAPLACVVIARVTGSLIGSTHGAMGGSGHGRNAGLVSTISYPKPNPSPFNNHLTLPYPDPLGCAALQVAQGDIIIGKRVAGTVPMLKTDHFKAQQPRQGDRGRASPHSPGEGEPSTPGIGC